jgi:hypothetical protein
MLGETDATVCPFPLRPLFRLCVVPKAKKGRRKAPGRAPSGVICDWRRADVGR